ncbi:hypothetical protein [Nocardia sp. NPDC003963]
MSNPLDDIVALRRRLTGESRPEAAFQVRTAVHGLPAGIGSARLFREMAGGEGSVVYPVRSAVLPDAISSAQRRLEASLLLRIRDSQPIGWENSGACHRVFRVLSPRHAGLVVDVYEEALERFLRALLPVSDTTGDHLGVPGLRFAVSERHLRMYLLDESNRLTDACVIVRGLGRGAWSRIWARIGTADYTDTVSYGDCLDPLLNRSPRLRALEREGWNWCPEFTAELCSPVLRRFGVLREAWSVDIGQPARRSVTVDIEGGPAVPDVLRAWGNRCLGLDPAQFRIDTDRRRIRSARSELTLASAGDPAVAPPEGISLRCLAWQAAAPPESPHRSGRSVSPANGMR